MHRIAHIPGEDLQGDVALVEQPQAEVLFLTSATSDISILATALARPSNSNWKNRIRALPLSAIEHPAQIDHYLATTAKDTRIIVVRLLGGKAHWSYGLDQLEIWKNKNHQRILVVLSGTKEQHEELHSLGNLEVKLIDRLADLVREGGLANFNSFLKVIQKLLINKKTTPEEIEINKIEDPDPWDWVNENGPRIGVILYRSLFLSGDTEFPKALNKQLRKLGLVPRVLWVTSLRDRVIQQRIIKYFKEEQIEIVLTSTSFATVDFDDASIGTPLWETLDVPVIQMLTSSGPKEIWKKSHQGLNSLDLSLQVVLPELDGRITSRPCSFRIISKCHEELATVVHKSVPNDAGLEWVTTHARNWIELRKCKASERRITLMIANYPISNGRIANGVGLDTPSSIIEILNWLKEEGYNLGDTAIPDNGDELLKILLQGRTNNPETFHNSPLTYLPLDEYLLWWNSITTESRKIITEKWGEPKNATDLEENGFAINGITFGNVALLIQPTRGYDIDEDCDLHSPTLPPPHRYLAQYQWTKERFKCHMIVHVGKHGSLEWLPGKAIGLSNSCFPDVSLGAIPHIYPFIVNDPGEGSQAKRRTQAIIIDHLTPPLGRAELHGDLLKLEALMDEYFESKLINTKRTTTLKSMILKELSQLELIQIKKNILDDKVGNEDIDDLFENIDSYLCELKELQIRTGLHILGQKPSRSKLLELLLCITRTPTIDFPGITQLLAERVGLRLDPWNDEEGETVCQEDLTLIKAITGLTPRKNGDIIEWLESQSIIILDLLTQPTDNILKDEITSYSLCSPIEELIAQGNKIPLLHRIQSIVWPNLYNCAFAEKNAFLRGLSGLRVSAGPSGAPTRGRSEVLPTGRNFYSVDLRGLPTEAAWHLGKKSAEALIELYLQNKGEYLQHLALSVWGTSTMRNGGEDICQLLALIGAKPVWDGPSRRVIDIDIIPLEVLNRPRVDVTLRISGLFRDAFPQLVHYVYRAQQMIGQLNEPLNMNPLSELIRQEGPKSRIYGSAPGGYGVGLQTQIDSGQWENIGDLANCYLEWSKWSYDGVSEPKEDLTGLINSLSNVQAVIHNQDNREHDLLDSDDYYQFHGGLAAAIEYSSGKQPEIYFGDHSRQNRPRLHKLEEEIDKVVRSRLLNPKWINGMLNHGYKGAFEMGATVDYLFAYDATTKKVPDWCYNKICDQWLKQKQIKDFLLGCNPWVLRDISERLLEAYNRNMWMNITDENLQLLKELIRESDHKIETINDS